MRKLSALNLACILLVAISGVQANAGLIVNVTGTPGSGKTTWSFSGSYVVASGFSDLGSGGSNAGIPTYWSNVGNYTDTYSGASIAFDNGGSAQLIGSTNGALSLSGVVLDDDNPVFEPDDWAFLGAVAHTYTQGETLTFSGSSVLSADIGDFFLGAYSDNQAGADLHLSFAAVPEPTSFLMFGTALLAVARRRRIA